MGWNHWAGILFRLCTNILDFTSFIQRIWRDLAINIAACILGR
jgi:hypothetical protein